MLPPHELKKRDFTRVLRGYNSAEVDEHIDFIIEKYTELYRRNDELERELRTTKAKLEELKTNEDAIRRAMVNAQRAEHKIVTEASERADLIMRTAKHNCDRVLVDFKNKIREERMTLHKLQSTVAEFKEKTLRQYQIHLQYIEEISPNIEGEEEWDMTEDEYTERLLEQMKLDIAGSVRSSFVEEDDPDDIPEERESAIKVEPIVPSAEKVSEAGDAPEEKDVKVVDEKAEKAAKAIKAKKKAPEEELADELGEGSTISFDAIRLDPPADVEEDAPTREISFDQKKK